MRVSIKSLMKNYLSLFAFCTCGLLLPLRGSATEIWASPTGNPNGAGTLTSPLTLQAAQTRARQLVIGQADDVYVTLRGGTYQLTAPLTFNSSDSGQNGHRVYYRNYSGELPVISGGVQITAWSGPSTIGGIGGIYQATGITASSRQLYVGDNRMIRARSAVIADYNIPGNISLTTSSLSGFNTNSTGGFVVKDDSRLTAAIHTWSDIATAEIVIGSQWRSSRAPIQSATSSFITMQQPAFSDLLTSSGITFTAGSTATYPDTFYMENALELLDSEGEWYLSAGSSKTLYFKPSAAINIGSANTPVILPVLESLLNADGVNAITFSGLQFKYSTWLAPSTGGGFAETQANFCANNGVTRRTPGSVTFLHSNAVQILQCTFAHLGSAGLDLGEGCRYFTVQGNVFYDISGSGIQSGVIDGYADTSDTSKYVGGDAGNYSYITNNYVTNVACEFQGGIGIFLGYIRYTMVAQNELSNLPYTAISNGWGWDSNPIPSDRVKGNIIANNKIDTHLLYRMDGGGIYNLSTQGSTLGSTAQDTDPNFDGLSIYGNTVMHSGLGWNEIYLDQGSQFIRAYNNVCFYTAAGSYDIGGNNQNNILVRDNYLQNTSTDNFARLLSDGTWIQLTSGEFTTRNITATPNTVIGDLSSTPVTNIINNAGLGSYSGIKNNVAGLSGVTGCLENASVRAHLDTGHPIIKSFVITGSGTKQVLIRALGPTLASAGVSPCNSDPNLSLYSGSSVIAQNDDWGTNANAAAISSTSAALNAPSLQTKESAVLLNLAPGGYSVVVGCGSGASGEALVEVYDADYLTNSSSRFVNSSERVNLTAGAVAIHGFIIRGSTPRRVVIRGVGPTLTGWGITPVISNPTITLYRGGVQLGSNSNWQSWLNIVTPTLMQSLWRNAGAFDLATNESSIVATLTPGPYSFIVSDPSGAGGNVMTEIYTVDGQ